MNSLVRRIKELYSEPIKRKVVFLGGMLFLASATFVFFQETLHHIIGQKELALSNQRSRRELGSALITHLFQLELEAHDLYHLTDPRDLDVIHKHIEMTIWDIKTALKVLQQGGGFEDTLKTNFKEIDQIKYVIQYRKPASQRYILEVIDIAPKIIDLEQILSELKETVELRLAHAGDAPSEYDRHVDVLFKQIRTILLRSQESANKIFHDTHFEIERLTSEIERTTAQFLAWRFGIFALLALLSLVVCWRTLRQISRILSERSTYSHNLKRAHESILHMVKAMPVGMVLIDRDHQIKQINDYARRLLRVENDVELDGKVCSDLFCGRNFENCPLSTGSSDEVESEIELTALDGSTHTVLKKALALNLHDEPVLLETFIDISDRKQAEKFLREKQNFINAIFQSVTVGIVVVDLHSKKIIDANPQAMRTLEADEETLIGRSCRRILCPHSDGGCPLIETDVETMEMECELQTLTHKKIPIIKKASKARLNGLECVIESFIDIQRLKKAEEKVCQLNEELEQRVVARTAELAQANTDLEHALNDLKETQAQLFQSEKMASIGQLAAGVAHEINNPVGFVHSNLNTIEEYRKDITTILDAYEELAVRLNSDETGDSTAVRSELTAIAEIKKEIDLPFIQKDYRNVVTESLDGLDRVIKIVADLKNFAHAEGGEMKWTDLNQGIEATLNIVWNEIKYKAEVVKELGKLPEVKCYSQKINQVLMNLLVNAAHAIEGSGRILIRTEASKNVVTILISDTGCGIPAENLSKIFDPFFTTKEVGKGTGLGLHVVYNIITSHNGSIRVDSEVGTGTTFTIILPIDPERIYEENAVAG